MIRLQPLQDADSIARCAMGKRKHRWPVAGFLETSEGVALQDLLAQIRMALNQD